jgi:hypothetical protein
MRFRLTPLGGLLGGLMLTLFVSASVAAYSGQVAATVTVSAPSGVQACKSPVTLTALVQDQAGAAIGGQSVAWSFTSGDVPSDRMLDTSTVTNASGIATTRATFACSKRSVTIGATADGVGGSAVVALSGIALPSTDTAPNETPSTSVALAALGVLLGFATILHRFAADRR